MKIVDFNENNNNIILDTPYPINETTFFSKLYCDNEPLYLQLPICKTKHGIVHTIKDKYCDLLFEKNANNIIITWLINVEKKCNEYIFHNQQSWFKNELSMDDIQNITLPIFRLYDSDKIILRTVIEKLENCTYNCNVYDKTQNIVNINNVNVNSNIIPLIFIEGISLSSKSFEFKIKLVQIMVIENSVNKVSEDCLIKTIDNMVLDPKPNIQLEKLNVIDISKNITEIHVHENKFNDDNYTSNNINDTFNETNNDTNNCSNELVVAENIVTVNSNIINNVNSIIDNNVNSDDNIDLDIIENNSVSQKKITQNLDEESKESLGKLVEIDSTNISNDTMKINSYESSYYNEYLEVKKEAEKSRDKTINLYLRLQEIKEKYLIYDDDIDN
tara:strand:- start:1912 stop:3075 length:1164 start_codon:yes stop_codon:yes gene_type:complete